MKLTEQEVTERYGKVGLKFKGYYKYTLSFEAIADDGAEIAASCGGNYHNIYRFFVTADNLFPVAPIDDWIWLSVKINGEEVFKKNEWSPRF